MHEFIFTLKEIALAAMFWIHTPRAATPGCRRRLWPLLANLYGLAPE